MQIVYDPRYLEHLQWGEHPESQDRLEAITLQLQDAGLMDNRLSPTPASTEAVELAHSHSYVDMLRNFGEGPLDPDTFIRENTFEIALLAAGGMLLAAEEALAGRQSMALVRPPGHHAGREYGCGFCYLNNAAIAASTIAARGKRVAVVDIDVHHGNGTNDIFHARKDVLYVSTHQWGIFPGTGAANDVGEGDGEGYSLNIPLPSGSGDSTFQAAMDELIAPVIRDFKPELMLVSLGVDAHYKDPLASLSLSTAGYLSVMEGLMKLAMERCSGRLAVTLEGGYHLSALAETVAAVAAIGEGVDVEPSFLDVADTDCLGREAIDEVKGIHASYWKV